MNTARNTGSERSTITPDAEATESLGASLVGSLGPGSVVGLVGELGAGKTVFVRGAVRGLHGAPDDVRSPTFTLLNIYECSTKVHHFDLYRLSAAAELEGIGFFDFAREDGITMIEWADRFPEVSCEVDVWVYIDFIPGREGRDITIRSN